jgi:hypothetical protein
MVEEQQLTAEGIFIHADFWETLKNGLWNIVP